MDLFGSWQPSQIMLYTFYLEGCITVVLTAMHHGSILIVCTTVMHKELLSWQEKIHSSI